MADLPLFADLPGFAIFSTTALIANFTEVVILTTARKFFLFVCVSLSSKLNKINVKFLFTI